MPTKPRGNQAPARQSCRSRPTKNGRSIVMSLGCKQSHLHSLSSQSIACLQNLEGFRLYIGYRVNVEIEQMHA
jgi:hypothetical protein